MIARDLRLRTVKIRTGAGDLKEGRKRIYLLRGNLEQAAYNLIAASCKLAEEVFTSVEKAREIAEAKRRQELACLRQVELQPYLEFLPFELKFGEMSDEDYAKVLNGAKLQADYKIQQVKKAEEERIAREKEQERIRIENEKLKKEAEAKEKQLLFERKQAEELAEKARIKADLERKVVEAKARKEREEIEAKAEKERQIAETKLKAEREAREKLKAEIRAKEARELQAKKEADAKIYAEVKARQLAEKKAKAAPDKMKLIALARTIDGLILPEMKSEEGEKILADIKTLLSKISYYIREKTKEPVYKQEI